MKALRELTWPRSGIVAVGDDLAALEELRALLAASGLRTELRRWRPRRRAARVGPVATTVRPLVRARRTDAQREAFATALAEALAPEIRARLASVGGSPSR